MTDDRITQIANEHFMDCNQLTRHQFINFARAVIEAECRGPDGYVLVPMTPAASIYRDEVYRLNAEVKRLRVHQLRTEQSASAIMDRQQQRIAELERQLQELSK